MRHNYQATLAILFSLFLIAPAMAQDGAGGDVSELPSVEEITLDGAGGVAAESGDDFGDLVTEVLTAADLVVDPVEVEEIVIEDPLFDEIAVEKAPPMEEGAIEEMIGPDALADEPLALEVKEETIDLDLPAEPVDLDAPQVVEDAPFRFGGGDSSAGDGLVVDPSSGPMVGQPVDMAGIEVDVDLLLTAEKMKRQAYKKHLRDTLASGEIALQENRLEDAIKIYEEAIRLVKSIGDRPEDRAEKETGEAGLGEALYRQAEYLFSRGDLDQAAEYARRSVALGHKLAPELISKITKLIDQPPPEVKETHPARWRDPEYLKAAEKVSDLLKTGREHFVAGELVRAKIMFETVLSKDPENIEAIRMLEKVSRRAYDVASAEMVATRTEMITDVKRTFNPRDYEVSAEQKEKIDFRPKLPPTTDNQRQQIVAKMETIQIPEIDFRLANINDVIDFLQEASVEFDDQATQDQSRGVNIILNLSAGQENAAAAPVDPFAAVTGAGGSNEEVPPITFSARYISLFEALRIVTEVANLKFRVTGSVVMVLRKDAPDGELIHRMYDVLPSVGEKIDLIQPALGRGGDRGGGDFISLEGGGAGGARGEWKEFFENLGVGWPRGSSIKYIPAIGKIVTKNTSENLTIFEKVLSALNVVPYQIEIEARFVEASQKDVDALGVEWTLTDDWEVAHKKDDPAQRIAIGAGSFTSGLHFGDYSGVDGYSGGTDDAVLTVSSFLTNPEVSVVLHALQQQGNTDLLSAPKVTTQSGLEATLKVVTEYIYPTSFELQNNAQAGNQNLNNVNVQNNVPIAVPEDFETREVGVILSVLPEVSPEGQMINLTMSPEVVSEPEWYNYGATYRDQNGNAVVVNMPQPFFKTRSIQTSISIYNGSTVVMGGLIVEQRYTLEDKIPILGDLPLIGRLFQSTVESSDKRNLLIFVTARLVDPSGRPVQQAGSSISGEIERNIVQGGMGG